MKPDTAPLWVCLRENNCQQSRRQLIELYAHLVQITAYRAWKAVHGVTRADLVGEGHIGLIAAVDAFDPARDVKFETYAITRIRGAILEALRQDDWVPRSVREQTKAYGAAHTSLLLQLRRTPTEDEVARELGITPAELDTRLANSQRGALVSLQHPVMHENHSETIQDALKCPRPSPDDDITERDQWRTLRAAVEKLPERERHVIDCYYRDGQTFKGIGEEMGISESRTYQLHTQATNRLRGYLDTERALFDREAVAV